MTVFLFEHEVRNWLIGEHHGVAAYEVHRIGRRWWVIATGASSMNVASVLVGVIEGTIPRLLAIR